MTNASSCNRIPWLTLALLLMTALPAAGQIIPIPNELVVVEEAVALDYLDSVDDRYDDVQAAINDAVAFSRAEGEAYQVLIVARDGSDAWAGGVTIPADANVRILGVSRTSGSDVFQPILSGGGDVITISTLAADDFQGDPYNVRIEGLHLINGTNGVRVNLNSGTYRPEINRCWMDSLSNHGVLIEGVDARAALINCSISKNGHDGVHINTDLTDPNLVTDILHCAIISNGERGVYVNRIWVPADGTEPPDYARVRNTIVYKNGTASSAEDDSGGLVWSGGITIIPEYDVVTGGATATIYGAALSETGTDTKVYFGPRDIGAHNPPVTFTPGAGDPPRLEGYIPPAYNSAPGKVDVHIVRAFDEDQERTYTLQDGFTYVEDPTQEPFVTLVTPAHGPPEGGNWVLVEGLRFNADGEVWFDFNGTGLIDGAATVDTGSNGTVDVLLRTFAPYGPVPTWTPNEFKNYYLQQGANYWLIVSNTVDTLTLATSVAALLDAPWSIVRFADLQANERTWLSSALLHVEVPPAPPLYNTAPMDVLVRNLYPMGAPVDSPASGMGEYQYRAKDSTATREQPDIVQIVPNFYRRLNTDAPSGDTFRVDILGWNFDSGCTVRIGGQMCSYASVSTIISGLAEGDWCKIIDVQVPLAEFGAGGSYDVEVTNPSGLYDILPTGFTYFADGTPRFDNDPDLPLFSTGQFEWLPANFIDYNSGPLTNSAPLRTLLGDSFDAGLRITFDDLDGNTYIIDDPLNNPGDPGADGVVMPHENTEQHISHTQRFINFGLPARPDEIGIANAFVDRTGGSAVPAFNTASLQVGVQNVRNADYHDTVLLASGTGGVADILGGTFTVAGAGWMPGVFVGAYLAQGNNFWRIVGNTDEVLTLDNDPSAYSALVDGAWRIVVQPAIKTHFYWIQDENVYFQIAGCALNCANGRAIVSVESPSAGAGAYIYSWGVDDFWVYVGNKRIPSGDIAAIVPDPSGFGVTFIEFSLASLPAGFYGQKDVTVVLRASSGFNPYGRNLYWTLEDGVYVPPPATSRTYGRAVYPRTVPADPKGELFQVRVLGSGLAGPYPRNVTSLWPWTDVELRWNTQALSVATLAAPPVPQFHTRASDPNYTVASFYEAVFEAFNVTPYGIPASSPGDINPVDVALVTYDYCNGNPLNDYIVSEDVIEDGIIFWQDMPRIIATNVSPKTVASGSGGGGASGTYTVAAAAWEPGAYGGHYLLDSSFNAFMIETNTKTQLTLYGGTPSGVEWRIEKGAFPIDSGLDGTWNAATGEFTVSPDPGWGAVAGLYLIDTNNDSFLIDDNTSNSLILHHTEPAPADGGWRIVEPVHWGPVSGGDVLNIEGVEFPLNEDPLVRIGAIEARRTDYNSGYIRVETPPAPFGLPATYDVSAVWRLADAVNTAPIPVEARAPESERFTYIMDGPPEIIEIEPDQVYVDTSEVIEPMQDPEQFITITGYNFDDRVLVKFTFTDESGTDPTTAVVQIPHFSVSPNVIVIKPPDFMDLLDPLLHGDPNSQLDLLDNQSGDTIPDGLPDPTSEGDHYKVTVTVTNYTGATWPPSGALLTSNPDDIFYVVDSDDLMEPSNPDLLFNDVYLNYRDYVNVNPGTGSIAKEPMFLPEGAPSTKPWWRGKLEVVGDGTGIGRNEMNPMRDKAGKFIDRPYTEADYELDARPDLGEPDHVQGTGQLSDTPRLPDIGADEIMGGSGGGTYPYWYYAEVVPDPVPALEAGELQVQIRVYDIDVPEIIYLVPQGVDFVNVPLDTSLCIPITLQDYGEGIYFGTNDDIAIETFLPGGNVADGHASLMIPLGGDQYLGDDPYDLTDGGLIVEQAITGRHFLIDTIPPRPVLVDPSIGPPVNPSNIMTLDNAGSYAAQGIALPNPSHPYGPADDGVWRPEIEISGPGGPFDQFLGAIPSFPPDPPRHDGTQAFFNVGSISNGYGGEPLIIRIGPGITAGEYLAFIDLPPVDGDDNPILGTDFYTGLDNREVSGFPETLLGPVTVSDHTEPPTVVVFNNDSIGEPAIGEMEYQYEVSSYLASYNPLTLPQPLFGNPGFDRDWPIDVVNYENDVIVSQWQFNGGAGIDYGKVSSGAPMHLNMRFRAVDLAGNVTGMGYNDGDALNSLHVWWMTEAETVILPDLDGEELSVLPFYWRIDRATSEDPEAQDPEVRPRFIWALWFSNSEDGPFTLYPPPPPPPPATPTWSTWSTDTQLADVAPGLAETLRQNGDGGMWFLLVVMGVDEAGNYEQWPNDLTLTGSDITAINGRSRKNWVRFYLTGGEIDTTLTHELWHNGTDFPPPLGAEAIDENFGPADIIARHESSPDPRVEGLFRIGVELPPGLEGANIAVQWSLQRDGGILYEGVIPGYSTSGQIETLQLPEDIAAGNPFFDYMPDGQNSVSYVLTAQAFWDENPNGVWDPGERIDNTPATVRFRVVRDTDHSVEGYYRRERQRGKQQIILREE